MTPEQLTTTLDEGHDRAYYRERIAALETLVRTLAGLLYHQAYRNHNHSPTACSACENTEKALVETLR